MNERLIQVRIRGLTVKVPAGLLDAKFLRATTISELSHSSKFSWYSEMETLPSENTQSRVSSIFFHTPVIFLKNIDTTLFEIVKEKVVMQSLIVCSCLRNL